MQVFISYASVDANIANEVCEFLEYNGHTCFIAPRNIRTGYSYAEEIMRGIDSAEVLVLLLSESANASPHVLREIERAVNARVPIITYKIAEVELSKSFEYFLMPFQWLEMKEDRDYSDLLDAMAGLCAANEDAYIANGLEYQDLEYENSSVFYEEAPADASKNERTASKYSRKRLIVLCSVAFATIAALLTVFIVLININSRNDKDNKDNPNNSTVYSSNNEPQNQNDIDVTGISLADYKVGMVVTFGTYLGSSIEWEIIDVDELGNAEMIAKNIITMKAFDGAESGTYGVTSAGRAASYYEMFSEPENVEMYGNSRWSESDLRTWLNSSEANVLYNNGIPTDNAMELGVNGYYNEPGFLFDFSDAEISALVKVVNQTNYYNDATYDMSSVEMTEDYVYILSVGELEKLDAAGIDYYAVPTSNALNQNRSDYYQRNRYEGDKDTCSWWLRNSTGSVCSVVCMGNGYFEKDMPIGEYASVGGVGVRPVIKVKLMSGLVKIVQ